MQITIIRHRHSQFGVDGILSIHGSKVCDTTEHPFHHLPSGSYKIGIRKDRKLGRKVPYILSSINFADSPYALSCSIRPGHGPFLCLNGSILVGRRYIDGVLLHTDDTFARLIDRLDKAQNRGEDITLNIV